ncbi:hypothetical protein R50073_32830 [Maricurvus nonylphenolicus]|uniref:hypothetical protein n=1 Tax=Maricurvus nonylphenolicus TaxID=1008307 RepID=UPI0036F402D9
MRVWPIVLLLCSVQAYATDKIVYYNNPNRLAPWSMHEPPQPPYNGIMLQLFTQVAEANNIKLEVLTIPSNRAISTFKREDDVPWVTWGIKGLVKLLGGRFDFSSNMSIDIAPFDCHYMIHKNRRWEDFDKDFSNARIILPKHIQDQELQLILDGGFSQRVSAANTLALFKLLIKGRGDIVTMGPTTLNYAANKMSFDCSEIKYKRCNIASLDNFVFIYSNNIPQATIARFNGMLESMINNGEVAKLIERVAPPLCMRYAPDIDK